MEAKVRGNLSVESNECKKNETNEISKQVALYNNTTDDEK